MGVAPGTRVSRYRIVDRLGTGGMGDVFLAEDTELLRRVALKVLTADLSADPSRLERFRQEAQVLAAVSHPNIVVVHSVEEAEGLHFITMELAEGRSLERILSGMPLPASELLAVAIPLADALAAAHRMHVIHRDVKPANIMVAGDGRVKVLDFGLAKLFRDDPDDGGDPHATRSLMSRDRILGTPAYMSPEQCRGLPADHRSDIFSTGAVLYEMATGRRPFAGESALETMASVMRDDPPPVADLNPGCPPRLAAAVMRCLAKDPGARFQSMRELREELRAAAAELDESTQPVASVAVLPFADMSPSHDQEYFCAGIAEEIINALTRIEGLKVASRMSSFQFRELGGDCRDIGRRLGVKTLLEGSVRKAGDRIRVTAQLIDVADGYHVWSQQFDRSLRDVFAVQDEIARSIVKALRLTLKPGFRRRLVPERTEAPEAYDCYLRGRDFYLRWGKRNVEIAIRMFEQAIEIDPGFASAHAGIAGAHAYLYMYINSSEENLARAMAGSERALELSPGLAEGHAAHGLALSLGRRHEEAEREFETAIRQDPNLFEAYYFYARNCVVQGDYERAVQFYRMAHDASPDDYQVPILLAQIYHSLGRSDDERRANEEGLVLAERAILLNPEDARACYMGAGAMVRLGQRERGLKWAERARVLDPQDPAILYNVACTFAGLGRLEDAIDCLERTVRIGASYRDWMENDSDLDPLRDHPRFKALLDLLA